jgi:hypothetical protein
VASARGDGKQTSLKVSARIDNQESCWTAARTVARRMEGEPEIQAHTNPVYVLRQSKPVMVRAARERLAANWETELTYFRSAGLPFAAESQRKEFFEQAERAAAGLRKPLQ